MKTSAVIIEKLKRQGKVTPKELVEELQMSQRGISRQLKKLLEEGVLRKMGRAPTVMYMLAQEKETLPREDIGEAEQKLIEEHFLQITPTGEIQSGVKAFAIWCEKRGLDLKRAAKDYAALWKKYAAWRKDGLIDGMKKMRDTFQEVWLEKLFYVDFYSIEPFGKTQLGQWLLYAKQSQNRPFIRQLIEQIKPVIKKVIKKYDMNAIAFIPPTVKREVQLMKELERQLSFGLPLVRLLKIKTPVMVPQKTLSKLEDRIENAAATFLVERNHTYRRVLLIDDAVGSGATVNETARQLKQQGIAKEVVGLAITGSFKGFDVISEV